MLHAVILGALCLSLGCGAQAVPSPLEQFYLSVDPNEVVLKIFFEALVEAPEMLLDSFEDILSPESGQMLRAAVNDVSPYDPITCASCVLVIDSVNAFLNDNLTYDDVRDDVVDFCLAIFNDSDTNGEALCPGTMDNYVPHIFVIMETKPATGNEYCTFMQSCDERDNLTLTRGNRLDHAEVKQKLTQQLDLTNQKDATRTRDPRENTLRIVHMTDIHVEEHYLEGSATDCGLPTCCMEAYPGTGSAGYWGSYQCNVPPRTTEALLQAIADMNPPIDMILYTGDTPSHAIWEETLQGQMNNTIWIGETFENYFPQTDIYACIGNHECFPGNLYYMPNAETEELNRVFTESFDPVSNFSPENKETIANAGYYSILTRHGLRVLAYNSAFSYNMDWYNWINVDLQPYHDQWEFMEKTLDDARNNGEKVILMGHHPTASGSSMRYWEEMLIDMVNEYNDVIIMHLFGHTHSDHFKIAFDPEDGTPTDVQYVGGTANARSNRNPNFRVFYVDRNTFEVVDFEHYIMDLAEAFANPNQEAPIRFSYSAAEEYEMADLSPLSWYELTYRFENDTELFDKYYWNKSGKVGESGTCNAACRNRDICSMRSASYDMYQECVGGPGTADLP